MRGEEAFFYTLLCNNIVIVYSCIHACCVFHLEQQNSSFSNGFFFLLFVFQFLWFFPYKAKMPYLNSGSCSYFLLLHIILYVAFLLVIPHTCTNTVFPFLRFILLAWLASMMLWKLYWLQLRSLFSCDVEFLPLGGCAAPESHCSEGCPHHHIIGYKHNHSHILVSTVNMYNVWVTCLHDKTMFMGSVFMRDVWAQEQSVSVCKKKTDKGR